MPPVTLPARCAVAVVGGQHLVSQVFPAAVPVEMFLDNVVELFNEELKRRGLTALPTDVGYQLHKANGVRLDAGRTLDELGVEDGATLVLAPAVAGDSFEPQYEALSTGLARIGKRLFEPVSAATAAHTALAVLAMAAAAVIGLALRARLVTDAPTPGVVTGVGGLLAAGGAAATRHWWPERSDLLAGFGWLALPLLATGAAVAAPGPLGAPHGFIAALTVALLAGAITAATGRYLAVVATTVTLCALGGAVAAVRMWRPVPAQWLGMGVLTALLLMLTLAPTIALWAARIRPPHFGSITGRDLFQHRDGLPTDAVTPVPADTGTNTDAETDTAACEDATGDTTPRAASIVAAALRANRILTGLCVAAGLALPPAVWATVLPGRGVSTALLSGLFVLIFISRGRAFADRRQAVALVCGAAAAFCAGVTRLVLSQPADSGQALLLGTAALVGFGGLGLAAALLVPVTRFTPLVRLVAEWAELVAIVVALPLAAWIGGLFTWVRMR